MPSGRELRQELGELVDKARKILDTAEAENRNMNADEQQHYETIDAEIETMTERIDRQEKLEAREAELKKLMPDPTLSEPPPKDMRDTVSPEIRAMRSWFMRGEKGLTAEENRALQTDVDSSGGYLIAPEQFVNDLIQAVDDLVFIRRYATTMTVSSARSLGKPSLDNDPADPTWTSEIAIGNEDSTMSVGKRTFEPHPLAQFIKVSNDHLAANPATETLVTNRLAYKSAIVEENAFLNGSGAHRPLGVFTASSDGITTSQDVSTDNATDAITGDGLINCKFSLKTQYWQRARWIFHRDAIKQIRKLKGSDNYIWQPGLQAGVPNMILDLPFDMSEYAPNTFTTGLYVGIVGDFSFYHIVDSMTMTIQRLVELYAATNQTGFISRSATDGMPVLAEAFRRVKLA